MKRFKYSLCAAAGILILALVLSAVGPHRVMAALGYTPVRDVDFAARQPVLVTLFSPGGSFGWNSYTIPANKRLVIEFVAIDATVNNGDIRDVELQIWDAGLTGFSRWIPFPLTQMTNAQNLKSLAYAGTTKIYLDPSSAGFGTGTAVRAQVGGTPGSTGASATITFSGYLEPLN